jgi:TonB family protein
VDNKRADIQLIQKYLNGELDAKAMHRLEREAQDDPFLMDALEGYDRTKSDQQGNLAAIQKRLQDRTAPKIRRIIPWTAISIAASVIGFAVIVGVLYNRNQPQPQEMAKVALNQPPKSTVPDTATILTNKKAIQTILDTPQEHLAYNQPKTVKKAAPVITADKYDAPVTAVEDDRKSVSVVKSLPDSSVIEDKIMGYMASKRQDTILGGGTVAVTNNAAGLIALNSNVKGASKTIRPGKPSDNNAYALSAAGVPLNIVSGVVLSRLDGLPLPGASVKVVGKSIGTQTDANGKFTLSNVKKDEALAVGFIGYNSKTLDVKGDDSLKVELDESASSLNEVVVTRVKKGKVARAHPHAGWDALKKYLKDNAVSADGKEGAVELAFTVNANGSIVNINVTKSLSPAADAKAISLIKDGPTWSGNTSGKAEDVKVKVEFHK